MSAGRKKNFDFFSILSPVNCDLVISSMKISYYSSRIGLSPLVRLIHTP
jgi:hypothetical protein